MKPLTCLNEFITDYWSRLMPCFGEVMKYQTGDDDLANILRQIMTGELIVWVWENDDGDIDGFVTTKIQESQVVKALVVDHAWTSPTIMPLSLTEKTMNCMNGFAKTCGCTQIKVYSMRTKMGRWFAELGFTQSYVEYIKEVE